MSPKRRVKSIALSMSCVLLLCMPSHVLAAEESWPGGIPLAPREGPKGLAIHIWYGHRQVFGRPGVPQRWVNILGRVSDPENLGRLSYSLNGGGETAVRVGPDSRRLAGPGDFNIEIDRNRLEKGENRVAVRAVDRSGRMAAEAVVLENAEGMCPMPYHVDWSRVSRLQEAVQAVDGLWVHDKTGVRTEPDHIGYDRVIAVGDVSWRDYEVTVPLTVNAVDESAYGSAVSVSPGFGIHLRWTGHTDRPVSCPPPHCGWEPVGASAWYEFGKSRAGALDLIAKPSVSKSGRHEVHVEMGRVYWFKARAETADGGSLYRLKVWEGGREAEPRDWQLRRGTSRSNPGNGSLIIVAHHVDLTVGNISITPVGD